MHDPKQQKQPKLSDSERSQWRARAEMLIESSRVHPDAEQQVQDAIFSYLTTDHAARTVLTHLVGASIEDLQKKLSHRNTIVLVMHPDGWIELYGDRYITARFFTMPPYDGTAQVRIKAQQVLESQMSPRLRDMIWPHATDDHPGRLEARRVRAVQVDKSGLKGVVCYTWEQCENPWELTDGYADLEEKYIQLLQQEGFGSKDKSESATEA